MNYNLELKNPDEIQAKMNSPEGLAFKVELENYGQMIAKKEYELNQLNVYQAWKTLRFREFLGYQITEEEKQTISAMEEKLLAWRMI